MNKILFLINPVSGSGNGQKFFEKYLKNNRHKNKFIVKFTEYRQHATELCSGLSSIYDIIIVCGGDGTFNEAVNGISLENNINIGLIPVGSGNDFIRNFSQTTNFSEYIENLVIGKYLVKECDVGIINYRCEKEQNTINRKFMNSCGIGFDAYVAYLNQNTKKIKGKLSYIYSILVGLIKAKPIEVTGFLGKDEILGKKLLIAVGNGETAGGGLYLTPNALINDNLLDFTLLNEVSKLKLIFSLLPKAAMNKIKETQDISLYQNYYASIELKNPYFVHVDGEALSSSVSKLELKISDSKLKFIVI